MKCIAYFFVLMITAQNIFCMQQESQKKIVVPLSPQQRDELRRALPKNQSEQKIQWPHTVSGRIHHGNLVQTLSSAKTNSLAKAKL